MPGMYPPGARRQICEELLTGERVAVIAAETGISQATLFNWKTQAHIYAGHRPGVPRTQADDLAAARRRIAQLEAELKLTKDASELFNEQVTALDQVPRVVLGGFQGSSLHPRSKR